MKLLAPYLTVALFAIWPFVNFAQTNIYEDFSYTRLLIIAAVAVAAALALLEIVKRLPLLRSPAAAAAFVALLIVVFFGYQLTSMVAHALFGEYHLRTWVAVALVTPILGLIVVRTRAVQAAAPVVGAILVAVPLVQIGVWLGADRATANQPLAASRVGDQAFGAIAEPRSVYLFVHDGYPRDDVLRQLGYDNEPFLRKLEESGFYVAMEARSNYDATVRALSSMFFMEPVFSAAGMAPMPVINDRSHGAQTGDNPVHDVFLANGYYTALFSSSARNCNPEIDFCATKWPEAFGLGQLEANLLKMTPLIHLANRLTFPNESSYTVDILGFLDQLLGESPVFLVAHIFDVHPPFAYKASCRQSFEGKTDFFNYYFGPDFHIAVECANRNLITIVERIIASDPEAIIVIAADHGSGFNYWLNDLSFSAPEAMFERFATLSAWRVPNSCREYLHPSLTPTNIFPIVFACLNGVAPRLLPDESWFLENADQWGLVPISLNRDAPYDIGRDLRAAGLLPLAER